MIGPQIHTNPEWLVSREGRRQDSARHLLARMTKWTPRKMKARIRLRKAAQPLSEAFAWFFKQKHFISTIIWNGLLCISTPHSPWPIIIYLYLYLINAERARVNLKTPAIRRQHTPQRSADWSVMTWPVAVALQPCTYFGVMFFVYYFVIQEYCAVVAALAVAWEYSRTSTEVICLLFGPTHLLVVETKIGMRLLPFLLLVSCSQATAKAATTAQLQCMNLIMLPCVSALVAGSFMIFGIAVVNHFNGSQSLMLLTCL